MKQLKFYSLLLTFIFGSIQLSAQISTTLSEDNSDMLGDNFSLEGALDLFKNASSIEEFETLLNNEEESINNLDLNDDGNIDYIRVEDNMNGNVHAIVLQAIISENESQDIAVIEIERTGDESATLQIVGDNDLYGENVFVEPFEEVANSSGKGGPSESYHLSRIVINVWAWPSVRFVYRPNYVVYRSPFRWGNYPRNWRPWRPCTRNVFHSRTNHYNGFYHRVNTHRTLNARRIYTPHRRSSTVVVKKSRTVTKVHTNKNGKTVATKKTKTTKGRTTNNGKKTRTTQKSVKVKKGNKGKTVTKTKKVKKKSGN